MEPIKHPQTARLRSLKMYREDLDEFLGLFQGKCVRVTISDKRYRYESFDEMRKYSGPKIANLEIHGEQPGLHFLLNQSAQVKVADNSSQTVMFNELRADEPTEEADALFFTVKDFLIGHQQPRVRTGFLVVAIAALCGLILLLARRDDVNGPGDDITPWFLAILFLAVAIPFVSIIAAFTIGNYLTLETKLNSPSFWAKHQDAFAAHAVTATISAVLGGGLAGWLVTSLNRAAKGRLLHKMAEACWWPRTRWLPTLYKLE